MNLEVIIAITSFVASILTFISGFGLGTILLPIFSLFFSIEVAIAATAIVHLFNNIFKSVITLKKTNWEVVVKFGVPSIIGAFLGSFILQYLIDYGTALIHLDFGLFNTETNVLKICIGLLILLFTIFELLDIKNKIIQSDKVFYFGGALSGFFGGISGHQGALRTLFLSKFKMDKHAFIATGICIAMAVDLTRIPIYLNQDFVNFNSKIFTGILVAIIFAFMGAIIGKLILNKIKIKLLYRIVAVFLIGFSICFTLGVI